MKIKFIALSVSAIALAAPQAAEAFLVFQPPSSFTSGRTVGSSLGFHVFQPFDVTGPGWHITSIGTDGWTISDPNNAGITGTLFADDGTGTMANEATALSSATYFLGAGGSANWQDMPHNVTLGPGRYWVRWTPNDSNTWAAIYSSSVGLGSFSRRNDNAIFQAGPTALRVEGTVVPEPATVALLGMGLAAFAARRRRKK